MAGIIKNTKLFIYPSTNFRKRFRDKVALDVSGSRRGTGTKLSKLLNYCRRQSWGTYEQAVQGLFTTGTSVFTDPRKADKQRRKEKVGCKRWIEVDRSMLLKAVTDSLAEGPKLANAEALILEERPEASQYSKSMAVLIPDGIN